MADNEGFRPSPLPPVCRARLPARYSSGTRTCGCRRPRDEHWTPHPVRLPRRPRWTTSGRSPSRRTCSPTKDVRAGRTSDKDPLGKFPRKRPVVPPWRWAVQGHPATSPSVALRSLTSSSISSSNASPLRDLSGWPAASASSSTGRERRCRCAAGALRFRGTRPAENRPEDQGRTQDAASCVRLLRWRRW